MICHLNLDTQGKWWFDSSPSLNTCRPEESMMSIPVQGQEKTYVLAHWGEKSHWRGQYTLLRPPIQMLFLSGHLDKNNLWPGTLHNSGVDT